MLTIDAIRRKAEYMPLDEQTEYLWEVIETTFSPVQSMTDRLPEGMRDMPMQRQCIMHYLMLKAGEVTTKRAIRDFLCAVYDRPVGQCDSIIRVHISHIRKLLPKSVGVIETVGRQGYRLRLKEGLHQ